MRWIADGSFKYGYGRNINRSTTPNIAALAPIPNASATITAAANPGDFLRPRNAYLRSWPKASTSCEKEGMDGGPEAIVGGYGVPSPTVRAGQRLEDVWPNSWSDVFTDCGTWETPARLRANH